MTKELKLTMNRREEAVVSFTHPETGEPFEQNAGDASAACNLALLRLEGKSLTTPEEVEDHA